MITRDHRRWALPAQKRGRVRSEKEVERRGAAPCLPVRCVLDAGGAGGGRAGSPAGEAREEREERADDLLALRCAGRRQAVPLSE